MKRDLELEAIVNAAMGDAPGPHSESGSGKEDPRSAQFRKLAQSLRTREFEPPVQLAEAAKSLMPESAPRTVWARLVSGSLRLAGARATAADSFQMVFEAEGERTRLMYARAGADWEVTGQAPAGWTVKRGSRAVKTDPQGRFHLRVRRLEDTQLTLSGGGLEVHIPSADQAEADGTRRPD